MDSKNHGATSPEALEEKQCATLKISSLIFRASSGRALRMVDFSSMANAALSQAGPEQDRKRYAVSSRRISNDVMSLQLQLGALLGR